VKVGDLVKYKNLHGHVSEGKFISKQWIGLVIKASPGGNDVEVLWCGVNRSIERKSALEVISDLCNS